ncbi:MAG: hypothetical protein Q8P68_02475 [Candidatus Peregrinibacteria bacterium]|nr:hypothetical protein [Candidatus Peregrinibacteria bacterium]MDZ4245107.1 hypothetical protein [Candidatus Gracilibacteria bacterium]
MKKSIKAIIYLVGICIAIFLLASCLSTEARGINILSVDRVQVTEEINNSALLEACMNWQLSKEDVKEIFNNARQISEMEKTRSYYSIPCEISGGLERDGVPFSFEINGGATIMLISQNKTHTYYGCSAILCEPYFLIMPDGMSGLEGENQPHTISEEIFKSFKWMK